MGTVCWARASVLGAVFVAGCGRVGFDGAPPSPAADGATDDAPDAEGSAGAVDAPATDVGATDTPMTDVPAMDIAVTDGPARDIAVTDGPGTAQPLQVVPLYPGAAQWNDYLRNDGATASTASGAPCTGTPVRWRDCLHGGEMRKVDLPASPTCAGLSLTDSASAFEWLCEDTGGHAIFHSRRLRAGVGLRDLIDFGARAWRPLTVTVGGAVNMSTAPAAWWSNPIALLPANGGATDGVVALAGTGGTAGTIYIAPASASSQGYNIAADGIAVVTAPGVWLTYGGSAAANCNPDTGLTAAPRDRCLVASGGRAFGWVEAALDGGTGASNTTSTLLVAGGRFWSIHGARLRNGTWSTLVDSRAIRVQDLATTDSWPFHLVNTSGCLITDLRSAGTALQLDGGSHDNVVARAAFSRTKAALNIQDGSRDNAFTRILSANSTDFAIQLQGGATRNAFSFMTIANSAGDGIGLWNGRGNVFHNVTLVNNGSQAIDALGAQSTYSHLFVSHSRYNVIALGPDAGWNAFGGLLLAGNNGFNGCTMDAKTVAPGVTGACLARDLSTGLLTTVASMAVTGAGAFRGPVTSDAVNASDTSGTAPYPGANSLTFDWLSFESLFRTWNPAGTAPFPDPSQRGGWGSGTGIIWDWRPADTGRLFNLTGNGQTPNAPFVDGAACPPEVHGDRAMQDISGGEVMGDGKGNEDGVCEAGEACAGRLFLLNAAEIIDDDIGNDDGLCQSGEDCVYAPHFGGWQGDGDEHARGCTFQPGRVTGVRMFAYPR